MTLDQAISEIREIARANVDYYDDIEGDKRLYDIADATGLSAVLLAQCYVDGYRGGELLPLANTDERDMYVMGHRQAVVDGQIADICISNLG